MLAAVLLLAAGCSSSPKTASATRTYTNTDYGFSVAYDSRSLSAAVDRDTSGKNMQALLLGGGQLRGKSLTFIVHGKGSPSGPSWLYAGLHIWVLRTAHPLKTPTLDAVRRDPAVKALMSQGIMGYVASSPRAVTLGGLPAVWIHYVASAGGVSHAAENYTVIHGEYLYQVDLVLQPKTPPAVASSLKAALRSFRVTQ